MDNAIVWADCEMTGLDINTDVLLEIAVLITDEQLNIIDEGIDIVIHATDEQLNSMGEFVYEMHSRSGLITAVQESTISVSQAEEMVLEYLKPHIIAQQAPLAGNSIATDRGFINRYMPDFNDFLHYRMIDVSSIKELTRRWYPTAYHHKPEKGLSHRALADILESIIELQYYRQAIFMPEPGYTSQELQVMAQGTKSK